jgi:hypothetical protein
MNQTSAQVRQGTSFATFPVRLPRWAGEDSLNAQCLAIPQYLVASADQLPARQIRYSWQYFFRLEAPRYPFVVQTNTAALRSADSLAKRIALHMDAVEKAFPLQVYVPHLYYDQDDPGDPHFELRLPPRSSMVSVSELFFTGLGFLPDEVGVDEATPTMTFIGGRGRKAKMSRVFGFFNEKTDLYMNYRGVTMGPNMLMDAVAQSAEDQFPPSMQVQAEMFEVDEDNEPRFVYADEGARSDATLNRAVTATETLAEQLKLSCNLKFNMLDVNTDGRLEMIISNRAVVGSGVTLVIIFDDEMSDAFSMPRQRQHIFNLGTIRSYYIRIPNYKQDPLERYHPMSMVSVGFGEAKSWVEGRGYVPLTAILRDKDTILSEGALFNVNQSHLTFEFLDSSGQRIAFEQDMQLDLLLKFVKQ